MADTGVPAALRDDPLVVEAVTEHTATVIFLHGLGDHPETLYAPVDYWRSKGNVDHVKFVLPFAPVIEFTAKDGALTPAWFDIKVYDGSPNALRTDEDAVRILESRDYAHSLIREEIAAGTPADRIILAGFSQGGAIALLAGLTFPHPLAGLVLLSTWFPLAENFTDFVPEEGVIENTPVCFAHGTQDRMVPLQLGKSSLLTLQAMGFEADWDLYPGLGHETSEEELADIEAFIDENLC